jgi:hypothetical protein
MSEEDSRDTYDFFSEEAFFLPELSDFDSFLEVEPLAVPSFPASLEEEPSLEASAFEEASFEEESSFEEDSPFSPESPLDEPAEPDFLA